jgi:NhaP-type Na+/H+ or K+/H+ antiporter
MSGLTILALVFVLYALLAGRLDRLSVTAPMVFVVVGGILGPGGTGLLRVSFSNETALAITEITLALLLFADASTVRVRDLEGDATLPSRLLFIGLPLTVVLGTVLAHLMEPSIGWAAAALVATILAPTDAALGLAVVTNTAVPGRIRRALNVESGLNDGLVTPFDGPVEFSETIGLFMSFFVWTLFGALFVGPVLTRQTHWTAIGYAVLSLTVVRMLPVALSLIGLGMHRSTLLFMGWFGPRGLASVVFTLVALEDLKSGSPDQNPLVQVATWTILLSVVAHGVTAGIWAPRYGARMISRGDVPELAPAHQPRMRKRALTRHPSHGDTVDQAGTVDQGGEQG